jgi:hypothetical protein
VFLNEDRDEKERHDDGGYCPTYDHHTYDRQVIDLQVFPIMPCHKPKKDGGGNPNEQPDRNVKQKTLLIKKAKQTPTTTNDSRGQAIK